MAEEKLTHWKKLDNPDYLGAYSLDVNGVYQDKVVVFTSIVKSEIKNSKGKTEEVTVANIKGEKPLILNKTNRKTLTKLFQSPHIEHWLNKPITLYVKKDVPAYDDKVDAIRIRDVLPTEALIDPTAALYKIAQCTTLETLKKVYTALPKPEQNHPEVVALKDKMKGQLK